MLARNPSDILNRFKVCGPPRFRTVFIGSFLIIACKNGFDGIFYPLLYNEDGRNIFAIFYNEHEFNNIFIFYASYIRIIPNLIGYLLNFLPVRTIAPLYCLISLSITALAYSLFYPVLNRFFNNRWFAAYSVLMISALPLANFEIVETLMYQVWNCSLILFLMALLPVPVKTWPKAGFAIAVHLLIWTHPYSIMALPLFFLNIAYCKANRWTQVGFAFSVIIYFFAGVRSHPPHLSSLEYFFPNLLSRVVTETLVGPNNRVHLQYFEGIKVLSFAILVGVGVILALAWRQWKPQHKLFLGICLYFILVPLAAALIGRDLGAYFHLLRGSPRYSYIPKLFFSVIVLLAASELFKRSTAFRKGHWALAAFLLFININSNIMYKTNIDDGKDTLAFTHRLKRETAPCRLGEEKFIYLNRGQWTIRANLCQYPP